MSQQPTESADLPVSTTMAHLRRRKREATQALLGDTISISDEAWQQPSRLDGWTRAHVATHIARNADGLRRVAHGLLTHSPGQMYPDPRVRDSELECGSRRGALDLQIDLDTSAGRLNDTLNYLEEAGITESVELSPGRWMPAHHLPVARLQEVVLHHVDLDCGFDVDDIEADIARWLLEWTSALLADRDDLPPIEIQSLSGWHARIGGPGEAHEVRGQDVPLLGWLTGRSAGEPLTGAEGLQLPTL